LIHDSVLAENPFLGAIGFPMIFSKKLLGSNGPPAQDDHKTNRHNYGAVMAVYQLNPMGTEFRETSGLF